MSENMHKNSQVPGSSKSITSPCDIEMIISKLPMVNGINNANLSPVKTAQKRAILRIKEQTAEDSFSESLKTTKKSIKFRIEEITESENEFRKKVLWHLQDGKFRKASSSSTWEVYFCIDFKLPESVKVPKSISPSLFVIIRLESRSSIDAKYSEELKFILLNNEVSLHHKPSGPAITYLIAGNTLTVPANKRFFIFNGDVCTSYILLLLSPSIESSKLPKFLS